MSRKDNKEIIQRVSQLNANSFSIFDNNKVTVSRFRPEKEKVNPSISIAITRKEMNIKIIINNRNK